MAARCFLTVAPSATVSTTSLGIDLCMGPSEVLIFFFQILDLSIIGFEPFRQDPTFILELYPALFAGRTYPSAHEPPYDKGTEQYPSTECSDGFWSDVAWPLSDD
jgi:hypothetical protein